MGLLRIIPALVGKVGDGAFSALSTGISIASSLMNMLWKHKVDSRLDNINEKLEDNAYLDNLRDEHDRLRDQISEQRYNELLNHEIGDKEYSLKSNQTLLENTTSDREFIQNIANLNYNRLDLSLKIEQLSNEESKLQYESISNSLNTIDEKMDCGLKLLEAQIGDEDKGSEIESPIPHAKRHRKNVDRVRDARGRYLKVKSVSDTLNSYLKDIDKKNQDKLKLKSNEIEASKKSLLTKNELDKKKLSEAEKKISDDINKDKEDISKKNKLKNFLNQQIELEKKAWSDRSKKAKEFAEKYKAKKIVGAMAILGIPEMLREFGLISKLAPEILTSIVNELKDAATSKVGEEVQESVDYYKSAVGLDKYDKLAKVKEVGIEDIFDIGDKIESSMFDIRESTKVGKSQTRGLLNKLLKGDSGKSFASDLSNIKESFQFDELHKPEITIDEWASNLGGLSKKELEKLNESLVNMRLNGFLSVKDYEILRDALKSDKGSVDGKKLVRSIYNLRNSLNAFGRRMSTAETELPKVTIGSNVDIKGMRMGPITNDHLLKAYEIANSVAKDLKMPPFDPMITSGVRDKFDGGKSEAERISVGSTHQQGRALDLRLLPSGKSEISNNEAIDRSIILGKALRQVLKDAGILEHYRIVSHGGGPNNLAPHFHLEYLGPKTALQSGDFVNLEKNDKLVKWKSPTSYEKNTAGQLRIHYPDVPNVPHFVTTEEGEGISEYREDKTHKLLKSTPNDLMKVREEGDDPSTQPASMDDSQMKLLLLKMSSVEDNLSTLIIASNSNTNDNSIYLSTPRRSI